MVLLFVLYLVPAFLNYDFNRENKFVSVKLSVPYLYAGDQIHYYVLVYSLLKDKDFDVRNNYDASEFNLTYDVGYLFRGQHLFREAGYFNHRKGDYKPLYLINYSSPTHFSEAQDPGKDYNLVIERPLGLPLVYYVLLLPFNFMKNPEPIVVFFTIILVLAGIYLFYMTLNYFLRDDALSSLFTMFVGISTEIWLYSKLFYPDVLQLFLLSLMIYLFMARKNNLLVGILFAIGIFTRPTFIILLPIFFAYRFFYLERYASFSEVRWNIFKSLNFNWFKRLVFLITPTIFIITIQFSLNYYYYGGVFSNPSSSSLFFRNIFEGIFVSFFKIDRGLLIFSPVLLFSFFGLKSFYKKHKIDSIFIYAVLLCFILFFSSTLIFWGGLDTYSIRYYVPIIPYFFIPMAFWYKDIARTEKTRKKNRIWLILFYIAFMISILINFQAAIFNPLSWNGPPWKMIGLLLKNIGKLSIFIH